MSTSCLPQKISIIETTLRDGLQELTVSLPTHIKIAYGEALILTGGVRKIEITNLGSKKGLKQFADQEDVLAYFSGDEFKRKCFRKGINEKDLTFIAVTVSENSIKKALKLNAEGVGPDEIGLTTFVDEPMQIKNSGLTHKEYWEMAEKYIKFIHDAGIRVTGRLAIDLVNEFDFKKNINEFTRRWFDIGADQVCHADHSGMATVEKIKKYFGMVLNEVPDSTKHIAHFHQRATAPFGILSLYGAMQEGVSQYELSLLGLGGQPANFIDGHPIAGTGKYAYGGEYVGMVPLEMVLQLLDTLDIQHGLDSEYIQYLAKMMKHDTLRRLNFCGQRFFDSTRMRAYR